jgi:hypothetical protein
VRRPARGRRPRWLEDRGPAIVCALALGFGVAPSSTVPAALGQVGAVRSAWEVLAERYPDPAARASAEERRVLELLGWEQLQAWLDGLSPEHIVLADGRTLAVAMAAGGLELTWWTIDGGGGRTAGGPFTLGATLGQPDAGATAGGAFRFAGGFWAGDPALVFADGFESGGDGAWSASAGLPTP